MTSTPTHRRGQRGRPSKGDRREAALLSAAERLLTTGRFPAASVGDLAAEAGISRASFYFYFASKQDLLSAVIATAVATLQQHLESHLGQGGDDPATLAAETVRAATTLWFEHRAVLLASVELGASLPEVYEQNMATMDGLRDLTVSLLHRAGRTDEPHLERRVRALILMTERNLYDLARRSTSRPDYDELGLLLTAIWVDALSLRHP